MKKIGRYEVIEELGRGAMGVVYKASDPTIGRLVAIKVLALDARTGEGIPGARDIFMREARAAGRLSHPGIVTIHDALEDPDTKSSYIVMEFIAGRTLEKVLQEKPAPSVEQALDIARQVGEALDYAHRHRIIHRDLKPANILLTAEGRVKITDFGIAKIAAREGALRSVAIMGTPSYMSPEQVRGGEIDARSDLFSLGILLYLMLTGEKPFVGDTAAVMFKVVYEDPPAPSQVNPRLTPAHDFLVLRCLVKDQSKRYASAREFLDDLGDARQGQTPRSQATFPLSELRTAEKTLMARRPFVGLRGRAPFAWPKSKEFWLAITAGILLVVLAGLGLWRARLTVPTSPPAEASQVAPSEPAASARSGEGKAAPAQPSSATSELPAAKTPSRAASPSTSGKLATLMCRHELEEATLTVSSGRNILLQTELKGRKKRGFVGIGGGFAGVLSRPISIPTGTRQLRVHVRSKDGSVDLTETVSATPPAPAADTLQVVAKRKRLTVDWK